MKPILLDSGVIVALLDRSEGFHERCRDALEELRGPLVTCEAVLAESCYLLRNIPGAPRAVLANVEHGVFQVPFQLSRSAADVRRIMRKYGDVPIDLADACLIRLADQLSIGDILTLDRDFRIYRWGRNQPFQLLIPLD